MKIKRRVKRLEQTVRTLQEDVAGAVEMARRAITRTDAIAADGTALHAAILDAARNAEQARVMAKRVAVDMCTRDGHPKSDLALGFQFCSRCGEEMPTAREPATVTLVEYGPPADPCPTILCQLPRNHTGPCFAHHPLCSGEHTDLATRCIDVNGVAL